MRWLAKAGGKTVRKVMGTQPNFLRQKGNAKFISDVCLDEIDHEALIAG